MIWLMMPLLFLIRHNVNIAGKYGLSKVICQSRGVIGMCFIFTSIKMQPSFHITVMYGSACNDAGELWGGI